MTQANSRAFSSVMNLFTMLFDKLWGKYENITFLSYYQDILKKLNVSKDMKNFHICNTFFKHIIDVYIVVLLIETTGHKSIDKFKSWVA